MFIFLCDFGKGCHKGECWEDKSFSKSLAGDGSCVGVSEREVLNKHLENGP